MSAVHNAIPTLSPPPPPPPVTLKGQDTRDILELRTDNPVSRWQQQQQQQQQQTMTSYAILHRWSTLQEIETCRMSLSAGGVLGGAPRWWDAAERVVSTRCSKAEKQAPMCCLTVLSTTSVPLQRQSSKMMTVSCGSSVSVGACAQAYVHDACVCARKRGIMSTAALCNPFPAACTITSLAPPCMGTGGSTRLWTSQCHMLPESHR